MKLRRLSTRSAGFDAELAALTRYDAAQDGRVEPIVRAIIAEVRARGDAAVLEYAQRLDNVSARSFIELELRFNIVTAAYGRVIGDRVFIMTDDLQVAKAMDVLPKARDLAMSSSRQ